MSGWANVRNNNLLTIELLSGRLTVRWGCYPVGLLSVGLLSLRLMSGRAVECGVTVMSGYCLSGLCPRVSICRAMSCRATHILAFDKEKTLDLQVFSQIGIFKYYHEHRRTFNILIMFTYMMMRKLIYLFIVND